MNPAVRTTNKWSWCRWILSTKTCFAFESMMLGKKQAMQINCIFILVCIILWDNTLSGTNKKITFCPSSVQCRISWTVSYLYDYVYIQYAYIVWWRSHSSSYWGYWGASFFVTDPVFKLWPSLNSSIPQTSIASILDENGTSMNKDLHQWKWFEMKRSGLLPSFA